MTPSRVLIVGCGYLGRRVGRLLTGSGATVWGTTRAPGRAAALEALGLRPVVADVLDPATLDALPEADAVLHCVGFDRGAGRSMREVYVEGLRNVLDRMRGRCGRFVHASSTGVYGQDDGGWVDEASPTAPRHESGRVMIEAEALVRSSDAGSVVLRFSGLYGPGRIIRRAALERGEPIAGDPRRFLNLIHIDDAAAATVRALRAGGAGQTYLISDDRPVERREYYERVAEYLGAPAPRFEPPAPDSPEARREEANKRISNRKMRAELGVDLLYPDIATGLPAALAAEGEE